MRLLLFTRVAPYITLRTRSKAVPILVRHALRWSGTMACGLYDFVRKSGCNRLYVPSRASAHIVLCAYVPRFWCAAFAHFDVRSPASLVEQLNVAVGCQVADFSGDLSVHTVRGPRLVACFVLGRSVLRAAT